MSKYEVALVGTCCPDNCLSSDMIDAHHFPECAGRVPFSFWEFGGLLAIESIEVAFARATVRNGLQVSA